MKLVYVTADETFTKEYRALSYERREIAKKNWRPRISHTKKGQLWLQYEKLLEEFSTPASREAELKTLRDAGPCEAAVLLVNDDNKVVAGATINWHDQQKNSNSLANGKHLPLSSGDIGFINNIVASSNAGGLPGLELQNKILEDFKHKTGIFKEPGLASITILAGHVVQQNALTLYEAAKDLNLDTVIREDLTRETPNGKSFFVATSRSQLVPDGYEEHVMPPNKIRDAAHAELTEYKKQHPQPRNFTQDRNSRSGATRG